MDQHDQSPSNVTDNIVIVIHKNQLQNGYTRWKGDFIGGEHRNCIPAGYLYSVNHRISATIYYLTRLQNLCITGAAAFSAKV